MLLRSRAGPFVVGRLGGIKHKPSASFWKKKQKLPFIKSMAERATPSALSTPCPKIIIIS
jgi:hypothetical protein